MFYTNYRKPPVRPEVNDGPQLVETAGYIPLPDLIANLTVGGLRLQAIREAQYMYRDNSIALQDTGMPDDIFMDKLEASDYYRKMYEKVQERRMRIQKAEEAKKASSLNQQKTSEQDPASDPAGGGVPPKENSTPSATT